MYLLVYCFHTSDKGGVQGYEPFQLWSHVNRLRLEAIKKKKINTLFCLDTFRGTLEVKFGTKTLQQALRYLFN